MYRVAAKTENLSLLICAGNISRLLSVDTYMTEEEAARRIPSYKADLINLEGYSPKWIGQMDFVCEKVQ